MTAAGLCLSLAGLVAVAGCMGCTSEPSPSPSPSGRGGTSSAEIRALLGFGVLARPSPMLAQEGYQPLMEVLTERTPYRFQVRLANSDEDLLMYLEERIADIAPLGIVNYIDASTRYGVVVVVKPLNREGQPLARTVFVTPADGPVQTIKDLRGHSLALGPAHSTLAHLVPRIELERSGLSLEDLKDWELLESEEAVVEAVEEGRFDAGAVGDAVARRQATERSRLRVFHLSDPLPTAPLVVRADLPAPVRQALTGALLSVARKGAAQRANWHESIRYGFVRAADSDYDGLRRLAKGALEGCVGGCHVDHVSLASRGGQTDSMKGKP